MPIKGTGSTSLVEIDRFDGGVGWMAYPEERMQRASHALVDGDDLWLVDPVDADGLDELLAEYGEVRGVVVLFDRHQRDAVTLAARYGVPVYVPAWMSGVADIDAPIERFDDGVGGFEPIRLVDNPLWQEAALHDGETLLVPESLGTASFFLAAGERIGVHPMRRLLPPRSLRSYGFDRVLVGHGEGVFADAEAAVRDALANARSRAPSLYWRTLKEFLGRRGRS